MGGSPSAHDPRVLLPARAESPAEGGVNASNGDGHSGRGGVPSSASPDAAVRPLPNGWIGLALPCTQAAETARVCRLGPRSLGEPCTRVGLIVPETEPYFFAVAGQNFPSRHGTKVLVVDDDPISLQSVYERLTRAGYNVFTREQALGTASWVANERPEFVILDVRMPALPGGDLAQLIHRNQKTFESSVILYSGMEEEELSKIAQQCGAAGYIQKTTDAAGFLYHFEQIVAQRKTKSNRP